MPDFILVSLLCFSFDFFCLMMESNLVPPFLTAQPSQLVKIWLLPDSLIDWLIGYVILQQPCMIHACMHNVVGRKDLLLSSDSHLGMISLSLKLLLLITSAWGGCIFCTLKWFFFFFCDQRITSYLFKRQHLYLLHLFPLALTAWSTALRWGFTQMNLPLLFMLLTCFWNSAACESVGRPPTHSPPPTRMVSHMTSP